MPYTVHVTTTSGLGYTVTCCELMLVDASSLTPEQQNSVVSILHCRKKAEIRHSRQECQQLPVSFRWCRGTNCGCLIYRSWLCAGLATGQTIRTSQPRQSNDENLVRGREMLRWNQRLLSFWNSSTNIHFPTSVRRPASPTSPRTTTASLQRPEERTGRRRRNRVSMLTPRPVAGQLKRTDDDDDNINNNNAADCTKNHWPMEYCARSQYFNSLH